MYVFVGIAVVFFLAFTHTGGHLYIRSLMYIVTSNLAI